MSLLKELEARGVTAEDLEKAAAVRLFEKAAAAEGVNLNDLDESRVEELFNHFVSNSTSTEKEASAMNDEIVELFEKTASAEGIDLDDMSDEDLAALYTHYVENVLPEQIAAAQEGEKAASANAEIVEMFQKTASAEGIDLSDFDEEELQGLFNNYVENVLPLQLGDEDATNKVADAQEKLAEAEILGRHMARAYTDEMSKIAESSADMPIGVYASGAKKKGMSRLTKGGIAAGATALTAGGGVAIKKRLDRKKAEKEEQSKQASTFDRSDIVKEAARLLLANAGYNI
jgi:hypothetical protein